MTTEGERHAMPDPATSGGRNGKGRSWWRELRSALLSERRLLLSALAAITLGALLTAVLGGDSWVALSLMGLGIALLALASGFWLEAKFAPLLRQGLDSHLVKFFHVLVAFVAVVPARLAVSQALQLPPQDFELAVALVAGVLYIPVWLAVASAVLLVVACVQGLYAGGRFFPSLVANHLLTPFVAHTRWNGAFRAWVNRQGSESFRYGSLTFGSLALATALIVLASFLVTLISQQAVPIRWAAYVADFQSMSRYPCLPRGVRVRLHENGVTSVAYPEGRDVRIEVLQLDTAACTVIRK